MKEFIRCRESVDVRIPDMTAPGTNARLSWSVDTLRRLCQIVEVVRLGLAKPQRYLVTPRENPYVLRRRLRRNIRLELRALGCHGDGHSGSLRPA